MLATKGYEQRLSNDWDRTAMLCCLIANVNSSKGKRFSPQDFHPLANVSSQNTITTAEERDALFEQLKEF